MPNQNNQSNSSPIPIISPQSDLPPLPPTFQEVKTVTKTTTEPAAPPSGNTPPANSPPIISSKPAKKFGGGRIIATLLGILLLVAGIGAGLILTQQQQLFNQKAGSNCCRQGSTKSCTIGGKSGTQTCVATDPDNCVGQVYSGAWGACKVSDNGGNGGCDPKCSGKTCGSGDGCNGTCGTNSGCNYCSSASNSYCSTRGGCVADSNGGHCQTTGGEVGACADGLDCSGSPISGGNKCSQSNGNQVYCCPSGKSIVNGVCTSEGNLSNCGSGLSCSAGQISGGTACNQGGTKIYCCSSGSTIVNNACTSLAACPSGRSCGNNNFGGTTQCKDSSGKTVYCCGANLVYDEFNGCVAAGSCTSDAQCTLPFQFCDRGTNKCVYPPNINCGRTTDAGAPVCCPPNVISGCETSSVPGSTKVCEAPNRLECKLSSGAHCTIDANGCTEASSPPGEINASCQAVKAYSSAYAPLSAAQLSALTPGTDINICVTGTKTGGSFDKAKFTIIEEDVVKPQPEITTKGQGAAAAAFCQPYKIPSGVKSFRFTATIHHSSLGWSN